jgi:hypothetical protein
MREVSASLDTDSTGVIYGPRVVPSTVDKLLGSSVSCAFPRVRTERGKEEKPAVHSHNRPQHIPRHHTPRDCGKDDGGASRSATGRRAEGEGEGRERERERALASATRSSLGGSKTTKTFQQTTLHIEIQAEVGLQPTATRDSTTNPDKRYPIIDTSFFVARRSP